MVAPFLVTISEVRKAILYQVLHLHVKLRDQFYYKETENQLNKPWNSMFFTMFSQFSLEVIFALSETFLGLLSEVRQKS